MHFASPMALLLLLLLPVVYYFSHFRTGKATIRFSSTASATSAGQTLRQQCAALLPAARFLALFLIVIALARPQHGQEQVRDLSKGIAIEMVLDRSGSMSEVMAFDGEVLNRLEVVKRVFNEFVAGNRSGLDGRPNDLIGLITFAGYADTIAPLTLGHDTLVELVEGVELVQIERENGTAVGDALALAAARLKTAEETQMRVNAEIGNDYEIKSKIIILLTDGQNTQGTHEPMDAAALAKEWGIKIYAVGIGDEGGGRQIRTPLGNVVVPERTLDEESLKRIAATTGGIYRRAGSANALREIYQEIDELEKSEVESLRYLDYHERFMPLIAVALILLACETVLQNTWLRRLP